MNIDSGTAWRCVAEQTLNDQDVFAVVIEMRSKGVTQGMASHPEMQLEIEAVYELSHIVFGGADRQPVALF